MVHQYAADIIFYQIIRIIRLPFEMFDFFILPVNFNYPAG